jgi:hypothetical protein
MLVSFIPEFNACIANQLSRLSAGGNRYAEPQLVLHDRVFGFVAVFPPKMRHPDCPVFLAAMLAYDVVGRWHAFASHDCTTPRPAAFEPCRTRVQEASRAGIPVFYFVARKKWESRAILTDEGIALKQVICHRALLCCGPAHVRTR